MKKINFIYLILILSFYECFAQDTSNSVPFWKFMSLSGEMHVKGFYRGKETTFSNIDEFQKSTYFSGGILLNSRSYIWHPEFLLLDVDITYNPGTIKENYMVSPDFSEVTTMKKLDLGATLFNNKKVTLKAFSKYNLTYNNREYLTNIKSNNKIWGGSIFYRNKFLPLSVNYNESKLDQREIQSGHTFKINKKNLQSKIIKSFTPGDRHELSFTHDEYEYKYANLLQAEDRTTNLSNRISLYNNLFFDSLKKYTFQSVISNFDQKGNYNLKRFQVFEKLSLNLPKKIRFINSYDFSSLQQDLQKLSQHRIKSDLGHQFYLSLKTNVFFEYVNLNHSSYKESNNKAGVRIKYDKKIPTEGRLSLSYQFYRYHENMNSGNVLLNIINEEHILSDTRIELLNKPYIDFGTVVVTDATHTIIYQLNFDYILVDMSNFIEIRRIPGGAIANGETLYIDYVATQPGTYKYDANNHAFTASIMLFNRLIEMYYKRYEQNYVNIEQAEFLTLNYYSQNIVGTRITYDFLTAGIEYDNYKSTIVPYRLTRYYIQLYKSFKGRLLTSLHGNLRHYLMLNNDTTTQIYADISGKIAYRFKSQSKLSLDVGYRNQTGREINLDILTARCEFTSIIRQLYLTIGLEAYKRDYIQQKIDFYGAYIRLARKF